MISLLIWFLIVILVLGLVFWVLDQFPNIPAPIRTAIRVIVVVIVALWLIAMLLPYAGYHGSLLR